MSKKVEIPFVNWIVKYQPSYNDKKKPYQAVVNWYTKDLEYNAQEHEDFANYTDAISWCQEKMLS